MIPTNFIRCIICNWYLKEVYFSCGHFNTCINCSMELTHCPTCNEILSYKKFICEIPDGKFVVTL